MIDLHCHLLPGVDDGPGGLAESLALARLACQNGITHAVVTPHIHSGRYENSASSIAEACRCLRAELEAEQIALELGFAGEVRLSAEIMGMVERGEIPFIGERDGYQIMLLEFPHSHIVPGADKLVRWLLDRGIRPMIAQPERNKEIMRKPDRLQPFIEMDCLLQLTAASVAGDFGATAQAVALQLLEQGVVSVLASDAQNLQHRQPNLEPGRAAAAQVLGEDASWRLVRDMPMSLVASQSQQFQFQQ